MLKNMIGVYMIACCIATLFVYMDDTITETSNETVRTELIRIYIWLAGLFTGIYFIIS